MQPVKRMTFAMVHMVLLPSQIGVLICHRSCPKAKSRLSSSAIKRFVMPQAIATTLEAQECRCTSLLYQPALARRN
jgi:predicted Fe-Mo cluster-binding NifX family protein